MKTRHLQSAQHGARQQGFTLIEILIAISLLSLIAAFAIFSYNGNKSKGQVLFSTMTSLAQAAGRYELDTSCVPLTKINQLFDLTVVTGSTSNSCGTDVSTTWDGPYMKAVSVNAAGDYLLPQLGPLADLTIAAATNPVPGGGANQYAVEADNIPSAIIDEAMRACNGGTAVAAGGVAGVCSSGTPAAGVNTMQYVFSTNN